MNYFVLFIIIALASWGVSALLNHRFKQYANVYLPLTGREVAEKMLRDNGITDVRVISTPGHLTDHYDPRSKTVNLSDGVYNSNSVAAAAIAAHECGHAVQHAHAYAPLKMRSALVPAVSFASKWVTWILLGGILLLERFPQLLLAGIVLYALTTLFSFITLPVEVNASQRAVAWLEHAGITDRQTTPMASTALRTAAYTYVVAALSSLGTLIYYILIFAGGRRN
jgi:Zn-dependent membrane protease YugP